MTALIHLFDRVCLIVIGAFIRLAVVVDLLIAMTALEHGATLVTNDHALLAGDIPGLAVENWS